MNKLEGDWGAFPPLRGAFSTLVRRGKMEQTVYGGRMITPKVDEFNVGDIVMLKSGGPEMTVENIGVGVKECVRCVWNHENYIIERSFVPETLTSNRLQRG